MGNGDLMDIKELEKQFQQFEDAYDPNKPPKKLLKKDIWALYIETEKEVRRQMELIEELTDEIERLKDARV